MKQPTMVAGYTFRQYASSDVSTDVCLCACECVLVGRETI